MSKSSQRSSLWPIHLKPKDDELLSSWLARLAYSHGLSPMSFRNIVLPQLRLFRDIDLVKDLKVIRLLAEKSRTSISRVTATTLSSYTDWLFDVDCKDWLCQENLQLMPPWIMPIDFASKNRLFGLQFCPSCLSEDAEPYFRRKWRLAFVILCEKHRVLLLDRCTYCGAAINLLTEVKFKNVCQDDSLPCSSCTHDLRFTSPSYNQEAVGSDEIKHQEFLMTTLKQGWIEIPYSGWVYSHLYFSVIHILMKILSTDLLAPYTRDMVSKHFEMPPLSINPRKKYRRPECLTIRERRGLVEMVKQLLKDWPIEFISSFGGLNCLPSYNLFSLNNESDLLPYWFWRVLYEYMLAPAYRMSHEEYNAAVDYWYRNRQQYQFNELVPIGTRIG